MGVRGLGYKLEGFFTIAVPVDVDGVHGGDDGVQRVSRLDVVVVTRASDLELAKAELASIQHDGDVIQNRRPGREPNRQRGWSGRNPHRYRKNQI